MKKVGKGKDNGNGIRLVNLLDEDQIVWKIKPAFMAVLGAIEKFDKPQGLTLPVPGGYRLNIFGAGVWAKLTLWPVVNGDKPVAEFRARRYWRVGWVVEQGGGQDLKAVLDWLAEPVEVGEKDEGPEKGLPVLPRLEL